MTSKLSLSQITSYDFNSASNAELLEIYEKLRIVKNSVKDLINKRKKELHDSLGIEKKKKESDGKGGKKKKKKIESDGKEGKKKKVENDRGKKKITKNKMMVLLIQNNIDCKKDLKKSELETLIKKHHLVRKLNALYKFPAQF